MCLTYRCINKRRSLETFSCCPAFPVAGPQPKPARSADPSPVTSNQITARQREVRVEDDRERKPLSVRDREGGNLNVVKRVERISEDEMSGICEERKRVRREGREERKESV